MKKLFTLVMVCFAAFAVNAQNATVALEAHDVWGDGTGYQLVLDADAAGWSDTHGPDCGSSYDSYGWEYMIPANASADDANVIVDGIESISVPAGTYSYVIFNPGCASYSTNYIASSNCDESNSTYTFEAGKAYTFTATFGGYNDCITLTVSGTGVQDVEAEHFAVYPNPATSMITVEGEGMAEIYNTLGQMIMAGEVNGTAQFNISSLESGVYFVRMNGGIQRIIKK
ncbi:MAG: DUF2436 domain-containing protein [Bacteroidales bacterium]|nr:DUF2436 domain-containing protein [Bacteroidales bacterium]